MPLRMNQLLRYSHQVQQEGAPRPRRRPAPLPEAVFDPFPALESQEQGEEPEAVASLSPEAAQVGALYRRLVEAGEQVFAAAAKGRELKGVTLIRPLKQVLRQLQQDEGLLAETVRHRSEDRSFSQRAANTAILSMRVGLEIDCDERRVLSLGLCALMHDTGMLTIPRLDNRRLTPEQLALLHRHPLESQRLVQEFGRSFAWIGKIVAQVHERHDGTGYPAKLKGEQIHEFARIIGLADTYEAMVHPRADREVRAVYHVVREIIDLRNTLFDRRLVKALIHIVSIFPLGSLVRLNNDEIGRVVGTSRMHPTRPTVEILVDSRGRRLNPPRLINLEEEPMVYVVDPAIQESVLHK